MIAILGVLVGLNPFGLAAQAVTQGPLQQAQLIGAASGSFSATTEAPMVLTEDGWNVTPVFTIGETFNGYQPVGIFDGIGAFAKGPNSAVVIVNHELNPGNGYAYMLANGTELNGARLSSFTIVRQLQSDGTADYFIRTAGMAYDTMYDRRGDVVVDPAQINETGNETDGLARFCSSQHIAKGTYGFVDNVYIAGEETGKPFHPHGGTAWILDVRGMALWAAPALGRGSWENFTPITTDDEGTVAMLLGDDSQGAPLYLYVGQKDAIGDGSFLDRNGLAVGNVYAYKSDNGFLSPEDFNGEGSFDTGTWVEVSIEDLAQAGVDGYDDEGYLDSDTLQASADDLGAFSFSRPEDLSTNPLNGNQAVFASTGRGSLFPSDNWGTLYVVDIDVENLTGSLFVVHDADGLAVPDEGIRSPDNLDWADNGKIYVQEDRSTSPGSLFGGTTGIEASIWELDPITRVRTRIATVDRSVLAPAGVTDSDVGDLGAWETSGVLDVTDLFPTFDGERLLIADVQAHGLEDGPIGGNALLDEGGQLIFLAKRGN